MGEATQDPSDTGPGGNRHAPNVLNYAAPVASAWTGLYKCADPAEMQLVLAELDAAGIPHQVFNENTSGLGPYAGGAAPEVHVRKSDLDRAGELVRVLFEDPDAVEPAPDPADGSADVMTDEAGDVILLAVAAEYDTPLEVRDAAAVLASARVRGICPRMVRRSAGSTGAPARYKLRVPEEDLERARTVLRRAEAESSEVGEERCPHCRSWRVYTVGSFWENLFRSLLGRPATSLVKECLACHERWTVPSSAAVGTTPPPATGR